MSKFLFHFIFLFSGPFLFAQTLSVSGKLVDEKRLPVADANIILLNTDSSFAKNTTSDEAGNFVIDKISPNTTYILKIVYVGYNPLYRSLSFTNTSIQLGTLTMLPNSTVLKQVDIEGKAPLATQQGDTTSYNANAYKVNKDATAEDLVTKMPGVTVVDGKVQAQGEDVKQVLVDGKTFFGDDAAAVLKNLPAEVIDKIQVFDKKSDQAQFTGFDDGNAAKTINIVTKPQFRNGSFGKVYAGYGYEDKYKAGGTYNNFKGNRRITVLAQSNNINEQNFSSEDLAGVSSSGSGGNPAGGRGGNPNRGGGGGGGQGGPGSNTSDNFLVNAQNGINKPTAFGLNYSDKWGKKSEITASYFFNQAVNNSVSTLHQQYVLGANNGLVYNENNNTNSTNQNNRLNIKFETKPDSQNSFVFQPRISFQNNNSSKVLFGENIRNGKSLSSSTNTSSSDLMAYSISTPILYRHSFPKRGRTLSLNANPSFTKNNGESKLFNYNRYNYDSAAVADTIDQQAFTEKNGNSISGNITYTEPLSKTSFISISYNSSYSKNYSSKKTYNKENLNNEYTELDSLFTNVFSSSYQTQSGSLGYRYQKEKFNFSLNTTYQWAILSKIQEIPTSYSSSKTFISFLPSMMLQYKFNPQTNLRIFYRSSNNAPSIDQLQDVINNSNALQLSTGNPDLKQDFQQSLNMRYSKVNTKKANSFFALLGGNYSSNYIGNSVIIAANDTIVYNNIGLQRGSQIQRPVNLDGYFSLRSFINYTFPLSKIKTNFSVNASVNFNRVPGLINMIKNYANTSIGSLGLVMSSNISEKIDFSVSSNATFSKIVNTLQTTSNTNYFSQNSRVKITYSPIKKIVISTDYSNIIYRGLTSAFNQSISLWNAGIGYKFLKDNQAEFRISVYDLLNQNNSIQRTNTESYTQDLQTHVLNRYYLATLTYNFKKYTAPKRNGAPK